MTKKSDRAAAKWFKGAGKSAGKGIKSVSKGGIDLLKTPFKTMENMVGDITSGPGLYMLIGGAILLVVFINKPQQAQLPQPVAVPAPPAPSAF